LPKGTFDYVKKIVGDYYHLASGKRLHKDSLKVIEKGYMLPPSALPVGGKTESGNLVLRFGPDWKVPYNVNLIGQSYTSSGTYCIGGYSSGVSAYKATGLEIVFYHTAGQSGTIDIASFPLVASAAWSENAQTNTVTLKLMFKNPGKFYGFKASYENNQLVISLHSAPPAALGGAVIVLDAGHGGDDSGSLLMASHATLTQEKQVTLLLATKMKEKLEAAGATVIMTRTTDASVSRAARSNVARKKNPDLFFSVHTDSYSSATASGTSAFYYRAYGMPLAKAVHARIVRAYREQIYTASSGISNYQAMLEKVDRGTKFYPYEVTRIEECPAILVEFGFGSNLTECKILQNTTKQDILAQAAVDGIADYLKAAQ
jgi:N-acetylmuramoyl-L-alanine amidase